FDGLATDLWLNLWTGIVYKVTPEEFLNESGYYLAVYALLSLCAAFATSKTLFDQMTNALPRAPMRFFDQNPHGRILNRYTNDIATIDMDIPLSSGQYLYVALGRLSAKPLRDLERVSKVATSPLLNLDSEAIEGVLVIRSEGENQIRRFLSIHFTNVDATNKVMFA
ncbi:unnamed protein product, partial [Aphanomyces euteiches]